MQRRADRALERLEQKNQHEEQHARRRFLRKHRREPPADPVHERKIQQREHRRRKRVHQIPLRPVFEKVMLQREVDEQRTGKNPADDGCSGEGVGEQRMPMLVDLPERQHYREKNGD